MVFWNGKMFVAANDNLNFEPSDAEQFLEQFKELIREDKKRGKPGVQTPDNDTVRG